MKTWLTLVLISCALGGFAGAASAASDPAPNPGTVLITGSDRGLGMALAREFTQRGWRVIATCREPDKAAELVQFAHDHPSVSIEKLDVTDNAAIDALVVKLKGQPIDVLFNSAGVSGTIDGQSLAKLAPDEFDRILRVNSYAPLRISTAFLDLVAASKQRKIIGMTSGYGSVSSVRDVTAGGYPNAYFYAMSKAALNMGLHMFALEVAGRGVTTIVMSPGAVDTDMQRDMRTYMAGIGKPLTAPQITPAESAHAMVVTVENLKPEQNGKFLSRSGAEVPW